MLRRFEAENFFSIRERQTLDLSVDQYAPNLPNRLVTPYQGANERLVLTAALFGANASGKSNVLKALSALIHFARGTSSWGKSEGPLFFPFGRDDQWSKPIRLYAEFDANLVRDEPPCLYSYEVIFQGTWGSQEVVYEALKYAPDRRMKRLFERQGENFYVTPQFGIRKNDQRLTFINKGTSVFSVLAQFNHEFSATFVDGLKKIQMNITPAGRIEIDAGAMTGYYEANPGALEQLRQRIRTMDLGIEDVRIVKHAKGSSIGAVFHHKGLSTPITLPYESEGTQTFFRIFPALLYTLSVGGLSVLDEMDRDIHPLLLPEIVGWFHDPTINLKHAQLIMTCQNATLLEHLIKEEVYLTEKSNEGETHLYGLQDIKGVRRESNLYAKYLAGAFGGVPRVG